MPFGQSVSIFKGYGIFQERPQLPSQTTLYFCPFGGLFAPIIWKVELNEWTGGILHFSKILLGLKKEQRNCSCVRRGWPLNFLDSQEKIRYD